MDFTFPDFTFSQNLLYFAQNLLCFALVLTLEFTQVYIS